MSEAVAFWVFAGLWAFYFLIRWIKDEIRNGR